MWELLYADDLSVMAESKDDLQQKTDETSGREGRQDNRSTEVRRLTRRVVGRADKTPGVQRLED